MCRVAWMTGLVLAWCAVATAANQDRSLAERRQQAIESAVGRVAPAIVRIDAIGGRERAEGLLLGTGPTTGMAVSADGYVLTSSFSFAGRPTSIIVTFADGSRAAAQIAATDHSRMLTLLKVDTDKPLPVLEAVPADEVVVGASAMAVGWTFADAGPNVSVGIVSAVGRIWGKAIQTDANTSPANYGGPLIDLHGRVYGIVVPLSPNATGEVAGVEWYDSGIGFAIPLTHVERILPRLKRGEDLYRGLLGVSFARETLFSDPAIVDVSRAASPARKAGIRAGDTIVAIDGEPVEWRAHLPQRLGARYAGETIRVQVLRDGEPLELQAELVPELEAYARPFLGLLPMRDRPVEGAGVVVRYVYPASPAATAGLQAGDRITALAGETIDDRDDLLARIAMLEMDQTVAIEFERTGESREVALTPASQPTAVPDELPRARAAAELPAAGDRPPVGQLERTVAGFENKAEVYVPDDYQPDVPHGIVLWLHPGGAPGDPPLLDAWREACARDDLIFVAPRSGDPNRWVPGEIDYLSRLLDDLRATYTVDASRIIAHGQAGGGALAYVLAFRDREAIRGVATVDGPLVTTPPDNEPEFPLSVFAAMADGGPLSERLAAGLEQFRERRYAVTLRTIEGPPRYLDETELAELLRWIDTLDRM